ncbi:class I SAM-dependent methyltransferase [Amycolatopsis anabasis]|uniref:class I SAM-dependent methyltransferase n=1 Tax=Amycolatopsis anabasis TaxID=1840409 RepID=UPI00131B6083|nr:class I SAM-dependent methyltransferase [Amycolatopsis anabasis]
MNSDQSAPFDHIGERYEHAFADRPEQVATGSWLIDQVPPGGRVLDHGCGSGTPTLVQLAGAGLEVVGVDESRRMLELARARVPEADLRRRDLRDLGPELGEFDAVASFFALLMLPKRDILPVLRALRERLRGPRLLALGMVDGDYDDTPVPFLGTTIRESAFPLRQLTDLVAEAGFEVLARTEVEVDLDAGRSERQQFLRARAI